MSWSSRGYMLCCPVLIPLPALLSPHHNSVKHILYCPPLPFTSNFLHQIPSSHFLDSDETFSDLSSLFHVRRRLRLPLWEGFDTLQGCNYSFNPWPNSLTTSFFIQWIWINISFCTGAYKLISTGILAACTPFLPLLCQMLKSDCPVWHQTADKNVPPSHTQILVDPNQSDFKTGSCTSLCCLLHSCSPFSIAFTFC